MCSHNVMVERDDLVYAWECAECGHVYGKESEIECAGAETLGGIEGA